MNPINVTDIGNMQSINPLHSIIRMFFRPVASFTKEVNLRLAKRPLKINGR